MPKIIADYHDNFIKRLINEGTNHIIRQYRYIIIYIYENL